MKPVDVKSYAYISFDVEFIIKKPRFDVGDHVRISKYKKYMKKKKKKKIIRLKKKKVIHCMQNGHINYFNSWISAYNIS